MPKSSVLTRSKKKRALMLMNQNNLAPAKALLMQLSRTDPADAEIWTMLAAVAGQLREFDAAAEYSRRAIALEPGAQGAHYNLACACLAMGRHDDAIVAFKHALARQGDWTEAMIGLGNAYAGIGELEEAASRYQAAIYIKPDAVAAYCNLGNVRAEQGRLADARECWNVALARNPHLAGVHSNLLLSLNYDQALPTDYIFAKHVEWADRHEQPCTRPPPPVRDPDPDRLLRVGYISPDFRQHSVAFFIDAVLANHDKCGVLPFLYADVGSPDATTTRLAAMVHRSRDIFRQTDDAVEMLIRTDGIDILVDLAGHTANNRLPLFARRPAVIQAAYLGYPNTTGMKSMDYRITDRAADPEGPTERIYTESLIRLPNGFLCYTPPTNAPPVAVAPVTHRGHITFASFNHCAKLAPSALALWARILRSVPDARLVMKNKSFSDPATRACVAETMSRHGVSADRLSFAGLTRSQAGHMALYNEVDIALDSFPYNGTTTTCDTLWMGVPVVALAGKVHAARVGVSILTQVGLAELIADSEDDYLRIATELAADHARLAALRSRLRAMMAGSPLCDGVRFTSDLEAAYRQMWRAHLADHAPRRQ